MPNALMRFLVTVAMAFALPLTVRATVIRVAADDSYPPYLFLGPDGKARGYLVDEWALWQKRTGVQVELIATNWTNAQQMLLLGQADVIEMILKTPERTALYDFTEPYARVAVGIFTDTAISGINDSSALKGFAVGVEKGAACGARLRGSGVSDVREFDDYGDLIAAASRKEIRIFCMEEYPANYYLYRQGGDSRFSKAFDYYSGDFRRAVRKGDTRTLALVQRGMAMITDAEQLKLRKKWMGTPVDFTSYGRDLRIALLVFGLVGIALLMWVHALRSAVARRVRDLDFLAYHDSLTGLPNRRRLLERIDDVIASDDKATLAVLFIGLDNFKRVNEGLGHPLGDKLLRYVAALLRVSVSTADTVARLSDDEFAILIKNPTNTASVTAASERILQAVAQPFFLDGQDIFIEASIGISLSPADGKNAVALLKNAAAAMFQAKTDGNGCSFYNAYFTVQAQDLLRLGASLRRALERNEFTLDYQPQACLETGRIVAVEALIRWQSSQGLISPGEFIPYAEETGLIEPIGQWVLQEACQQLARWLEGGMPPIRMAVNISPRQLGKHDLLKQVQSALTASQIPPHLLELEITESALMEHGATATEILVALRELGVFLAIDDFGTGYSSLAYLRHFPVGLLKIDQSFMVGVPEEESAAEITSAIVGMAHTLHMRVLAEGVENAQQWAFLKRIGCDYAQGWYFSRAVSANEIKTMLCTEKSFAQIANGE